MMELNIKIEKLQYLQLGREGESDALTVNIDMSSWVDEHPDISMVCFVIMQQPGQQNGYPKTTVWNSATKILTWNVSTDATSVQGTGYIEVRAIDSQAEPDHETDSYSGFVKKSKMIPVLIDNSVSHLTGTAVPTAYNDFLNQVLKTVDNLNNIFEEATTEYVISTSYSTIPTAGWSTTMPDISENKGKYLWTRITFNWATGSSSSIHMVTYISIDTTGEVTSINGKTGQVVLDGDDIDVDKTAQTPETIKDAVNRLTSAATPNSIMTATETASSAPDSGDYLLIGKSDGTEVKRKTLSTLFSASELNTLTGGGVVKKHTVSLDRESEITTATFSTSKGTVAIRTGHYYANNLTIPDTEYVIAALVATETHDNESAFLDSGTMFGTPLVGWKGELVANKYCVRVPYIQIVLGSSMPSGTALSSITVNLYTVPKAT